MLAGMVSYDENYSGYVFTSSQIFPYIISNTNYADLCEFQRAHCSQSVCNGELVLPRRLFTHITLPQLHICQASHCGGNP